MWNRHFQCGIGVPGVPILKGVIHVKMAPSEWNGLSWYRMRFFDVE